MLTSLLMALLLPTASASSDIEFKTSGPVLIYVDGKQAQLTSKLKQKLEDLEPGDHQIKVTGVFGKTLYEAEISLPDNTVTLAEWSGRELAVVSTDWRDEANEADDSDEADAEEVIAEAPEEEEEQVVAAEPAMPEAPVPLALPVDTATALPVPVMAKTLTVQAQDGMRVEVVYEGQTVVVVIDQGSFRIEDPSGLQIALTASR